MARQRPALAVALLATAYGAAVSFAAGPAVFTEPFSTPKLDPAWTVDVSPGNTITVADGALEIRAAENTFAHIERPLGADCVRAACAIRPGTGVSWCTSLFLYWGPGNWCQMGVIPRGDGRYYACVTTAGRRDEHDLSRCRFDGWCHVAIELGDDCVRFLSSADGKTWQLEALLPRPERLRGPVGRLIVGKGFGLDDAHPDLDSDYGDRGPVAVSRVKGIVVMPTDPAQRKITPADRRALDLRNRDRLGEQILATGRDPDFDTVAALLPPLAKPRETTGVPEHPYEIAIDYAGTIQLATDADGWQMSGPQLVFEIGSPPVAFGAHGCAKRLLDGYLPIVVATAEHDGLRYEQTVVGHADDMSPDRPLSAYVRLVVHNPTATTRSTAVALRPKAPADTWSIAPRTLEIAAGGSATMCARIPVPFRADAAVAIGDDEFARRLDDAARFWRALLGEGMQIRVPEPRVNDACRAWLAYNFLDVDRKAGRSEPHDGAGFYEEIFGYSAALYAHALDLWGYHERARRILESLVSLRKPDGLFFVRYGLPDHGALLLAMCEHYRLTGDADWLRAQAPGLVRMCDWIVHKRRESMTPDGPPRTVTYGLIRFTPYADYQEQTVDYYGDAYGCVGMEHVAAVLPDIGQGDEAARLAHEAALYRRDILASMDAAVFERDGMRLLPMEPDTHRLLESTQYCGGGYYGLIASMMLESEFLPAGDPRARLVTDALEQRRGLILGMCEFDDGVDHAYTYGYWLNRLRRDDVRRVLLGFYGSLAYGMGRDTYGGVEVTQILTGEPTPTIPHLYSGTQQLRLLRMMLLREEAGSLRIGDAIPRAWLKTGSAVEVRDAPTSFGPVSFELRAEADGKAIRVRLDPPRRKPPLSIVVRPRHPDARAIRRVTSGEKTYERFTSDTVTIDPGGEAVELRVEY